MSRLGHWTVPSRALALVTFLWLAVRLGAQPSNVLLLPAPGWVRPSEWTAATDRTSNDKSEGARFLLYELQERPKSAEKFVRVVSLMENESGVQDSGSLSFSFDPNYQQLQLHRLAIHRGGKVIDRLSQSKIRLIQPEPDLDGHIVTGRQTALVFVEDLRVGDALEYAYSLRGANPVFAGHYATRFVAQSGIAVERELFRVVWDSPTPLEQRTHQTEAEPVIVKRAGSVEYAWNFTNLTTIPYEDCQPPSYEPYPYVEVSDFTNWSEVVNWSLPLYASSQTNLPAELQELIARWQSSTGSMEEKVRSALQFVQDDLRYTGIELGPDSYRPTAPIETFERRYGDCKGKVALFCFLLRAMGVEAYPALVSTSLREGSAQRLPSPFVFNHVIAKLVVEGKTVWVDPTRSHQGGTLWSRYLPPYGKALVIRAGVQALEDVPRAQVENGLQQKSIATVTIKDYEGPTQFTVRTEYRGGSADTVRGEVAGSNPEDLARNYLNYYARFYPSIKTNQPLLITDDRLQNLLSIEESYVVTNLWERDATGNLKVAHFYADNLYNALTEPSTRIRKTPLYFVYPLRRQQEITVKLPDSDWNIPDLEKTVEQDAFAFSYSRKLTGSSLHLQYECRTRLAELPTEKVSAYLAKLKEMTDLLDDTLQRPNGTRKLAHRINWIMVLMAMFGVGFTALGGVWYWRRASIRPGAEVPPLIDPDPEEQRLRGLGGWLILIGFGLCLGPVTRLVMLGRNWEGYFSIAVWQSVAMPQGDLYHPLHGPLLIFEILSNTLLLGLNLLALGLFFSKRRAFPRVFILMVVLNVCFVLLDDFCCKQIPSLESATTVANRTMSEGVRAAIYAIIWGLYMLKSRRVKVTFVN